MTHIDINALSSVTGGGAFLPRKQPDFTITDGNVTPGLPTMPSNPGFEQGFGFGLGLGLGLGRSGF